MKRMLLCILVLLSADSLAQDVVRGSRAYVNIINSPILIAHGQAPGHSQLSIRGLVQDISASTAAGAVWALGGEYPWPAAAVSLEFLSSSASDTSAGTGARTVLIQGLDASWVQQTSIISTNGVTPVVVPNTWLRVNLMVVLTAGSAGRNVGTLRARVAGGGTTLRVVQLFHNRGMGISTDGIYTVPAGHLLYVEDAILDYAFLGALSYNVEVRDNRSADASWVSGAVLSANENGTTTLTFSFHNPLVFTEKMDIQVVTVGATSPVFNTFSFLAQGVLVAPGYF